MPFAIMAHFPLGTYRAHLGADAVDPLPSPARLHAAFLAAAGSGVRAHEDGDVLTPSPDDRAALEWLDRNPPDELIVPHRKGSPREYIRFRSTGQVLKEGGNWVPDKKIGDVPESQVALSGPLGWLWREEPPADVAHSLSQIAPDVSHLGTAESPVCMRVVRDAHTPTTHVRDDDAVLWSAGPANLDLDTPAPGRTEALVTAYRTFNAPRRGKEAHGTTDDIVRPPRVETHLEPRRYRPHERRNDNPEPWDRLLLISLKGRRIPPEARVFAAVRFHRALIATIGDGAPPLVTGHYERPGSRPANRLAIQFLDADMPSSHVSNWDSTLALLIPRDAEDADVAIVEAAVRSMRGFDLSRRHHVRFGQYRPREVLAARFWDRAATTHVRTAVPALSDIRPNSRPSWSVADAVALGVGLVWRDHIAPPGRGPQWMRRVADLVLDAGLAVHSVEWVRGSRPGRYAHRVHPDAVVAPFHARLSLPDFADAAALVAIGQNRHLGGGLLVPVEGEIAA